METISYVKLLDDSINNCTLINTTTTLVLDQTSYNNICKEIGRKIRKYKGYKIKVI